MLCHWFFFFLFSVFAVFLPLPALCFAGSFKLYTYKPYLLPFGIIPLFLKSSTCVA